MHSYIGPALDKVGEHDVPTPPLLFQTENALQSLSKAFSKWHPFQTANPLLKLNSAAAWDGTQKLVEISGVVVPTTVISSF